jgi:ABC-type transporter Mla MlaB component
MHYQESNSQGTLVLDGDITVNTAEELRTHLIKAMINVEELSVEFGNIGDIDLSCLQLLCSAHRSAVRMNKRVTVSGAWPDRFRKTVRDAGFERNVGCSLDSCNSCLWMKK